MTSVTLMIIAAKTCDPKPAVRIKHFLISKGRDGFETVQFERTPQFDQHEIALRIGVVPRLNPVKDRLRDVGGAISRLIKVINKGSRNGFPCRARNAKRKRRGTARNITEIIPFGRDWHA